MAQTAKQPDWKRIQAFIASLPDVITPTEQSHDKNWNDFRRAEDFAAKQFAIAGAQYRPHFRDRVFEIADEFNLNVMQTARLVRRLAELQSEHIVLVSWQRAPTAGAAASALAEIEKSILRIAKFAESDEASKRAAIDYLNRAVARRMRVTPSEQLQVLGMEALVAAHPTAGEIYTNNSNDVLHRWLKTARFIHEALADEVQRLSLHVGRVPDAEKLDWHLLRPALTTPIVTLVGGRLPSIYERIVGKPFDRQRHVETEHRPFDGLQDTGGMRFVRLCLDAMGLGHYELETISRHYTEFRAAKAVDAAPEIS